MSIDIRLHFPHADWTVRMPAVPRQGEVIAWDDPEQVDTLWTVSEVEYMVDRYELGIIGLLLEPADEHTRKFSARHAAEGEGEEP